MRRPSQHGSLKIDLSQRVTECGEWRGESRQETGGRRQEEGEGDGRGDGSQEAPLSPGGEVLVRV